jgi:hypothetical protein
LNRLAVRQSTHRTARRDDDTPDGLPPPVRVACDADGIRTWFTTVPPHSGDIPADTLRAIERDLEDVFGKGWLR